MRHLNKNRFFVEMYSYLINVVVFFITKMQKISFFRFSSRYSFTIFAAMMATC